MSTLVPIPASTVTARLWLFPHHVLRVWLWLKLRATLEGYVEAAPAGLALATLCTVDEVKEALALLSTPDPADPTSEPIIVRQGAGWVVVATAAEYAEQTRLEKMARRRAYARKRYWDTRGGSTASENILTEPVSESGSGESEKPFPDLETPFSDSAQARIAPLPPAPPSLEDPLLCSGSQQRISGSTSSGWKRAGAEAPTEADATLPAVYRTLAGWEPSDELRAEAAIVGVSPEFFDQQLAELRNGPIGGSRGVLDRDDYVRLLLPKWRTWEETAKAKAKRDAEAASRPRGARAAASLRLEPTARHQAFAERFGIDLGPILRDLDERGVVDSLGLGRARELLEAELARLARAQRGAA